MKNLLFMFLILPILASGQNSFQKGEKLHAEAKYELAKTQFESYLKDNPNHTKTIEYLGDIAGSLKEWDNSILYYSKLKKQFPKNAIFWYKYGGSLGMKAKTSNKFKALSLVDDVETAFLTAANLDPKQVETRWALVMLYLELPGIIGGSEAKSRKYSEELLKISAVDGYLSRGYIAEYFKRYTIAEKNYLKAIEIGQSKVCYQKLADLYKNKMNSPEKAKTTMAAFEKKATN